MTKTTQTRTQTDWDQAKQENKARAARVREILKAAASETFSEVKAGSADLHVLTRKSLGTWLDDLQEASKSAETIYDASKVEQSDEPSETANETQTSTVPTWRELIMQSLGVVRDRKGDWLQQLINHWHEQTAKFDADMTQEHGDRYGKVKSVFQQVAVWLKSTRSKDTDSTDHQAAHRVTVEVIEDESDTLTETEKTV